MAGLGLFFCWSVPTKAAVVDHLVINELATAGDSSYDDWVELYNPTGSEIELLGWSVQKVTAGGGVTRTDLSGTIPAYGYFLVVRNDDNTMQSLKDVADLKAENFALADGNALYLVYSNSDIDPDIPGVEVIDAVGWGAVIYGEGTAITSNISAGKSLSRIIDGDVTDDNSIDFTILDTPTMQNSGLDDGMDGDVSGDVLITIYPDNEPVQNITADSASIVFQVNTDGIASVDYGLSDVYGNSSLSQPVLANTDVTVVLENLECNTTYHYMINVEGDAGIDPGFSDDITFTTLPCGGITVDNIVMTQSSARANDIFADGWEWQFDITVWNPLETELKMKFNIWNGSDSISSGGNVRYSIDNGLSWVEILSDDTYPDAGANISSLDENETLAGQQISILVQMKVPVGTLAGAYSTSYGIVTEEPGL